MLTVYGTPRSRTSVVLWLLREMGMQYRHVVALVNASGVDEDHPYDAEKYAEASAALSTPLQRFDNKLGGREYLVGGRLTVADINVAFLLSFLLLLNYDLSGIPNVERFMASMTSRTSFRSILAPTEEHVAVAIPAWSCQ